MKTYGNNISQEKQYIFQHQTNFHFYTGKADDWLKLYLAPQIGLRRFYRLLDMFKDPANVFPLSLKSLSEVTRLSASRAKQIQLHFSSPSLAEELRRIKAKHISLYHLLDECYPKLLREIYQPPPVLYCKGNFKKADNNCIAIVGTRRASQYGIATAEKLAYELAIRGITVVSGLAHGIDQAAHQGALKAKGRTIAVIGSGLGNIYPRGTENLCNEIEKNGVLISEFPIPTPPNRINFPIRNRIISGLSLGVVVVEAPQQSGALITANFALEQGREVFAIPGRITSKTSAGSNKLIQMGAKLVIATDDIIEEVLPQLEMRILPAQKKSSTEIRLTDVDEKRLFDLIRDEPKHIDTLQRNLQWAPGKVAMILVKLELRGLLRQLPGKMYVRSLQI